MVVFSLFICDISEAYFTIVNESGCWTAFYLHDDQYVWTINLQYYHDDKEVLHHSLVSRLIQTFNLRHAVVRNVSRIRWLAV